MSSDGSKKRKRVKGGDGKKEGRKRPTKRGLAEERIYRALADDEIRLLGICPGEYDDDLHGSLHHAELEIYEDKDGYSKGTCNVAFEAISYAWGSSDKPCGLNTVAGVIPITLSLDQALRRYRCRETHRLLWADAVCINQDDLLEKNAQVEKMHEIYSSSVRVLVWLGPSGDVMRESKAIEVMRACQMRLNILYPGLESDSSETDEASKTTSTPNLHDGWSIAAILSSIDSGLAGCMRVPPDELFVIEGLRAVATICQRPWFSRLWVLQETSSRFNEVTFSIGQLDFERSEFTPSINALQENWTDLRFEQGNLKIHKDETYYKDIQDTLESDLWNVPLTGMMVSRYLQYSVRNCSDPRDRIFALRNVMHMTKLDDLRPDYTIDADEVFRRFVHRILVRSARKADPNAARDVPGRALMLAMVGTERQQSESIGRPSWTPDLHNLSDATRAKSKLYHGRWLGARIARYAAQRDGELPDEFVRHWSEMCRQFECRGVPGNPMRIEIRGNWVGFISQQADCPEWPETPGTAIDETLKLWFDQCCQVISCNAGLTETPPRSAVLRFLGYMSFWIEGRPKMSMEDLCSRHVCHSLCQGLDSGLRWICWLLHAVERTRRSGHVRLRRIRTVYGSDVAWLPAAAQAGDQVYLFAGTMWPFAVRRNKDGCYRLLGDGHTFSTPLVEALGGRKSDYPGIEVVYGEPLGCNMFGLPIKKLMENMRWITLA